MRLDLQGKTVVIFGGAGFIGKRLVSGLSKHPCKIIVVTRKPNNHEELRILAGLGQITVVNLKEYRKICEKHIDDFKKIKRISKTNI